MRARFRCVSICDFATAGKRLCEEFKNDPVSSVSIELEGVRVHNLKNVSLNIRRNTLTVICGVSGSGKSSLAFDTVFAEGQRRYVETFSPYARQFLDRVERPDVDRIGGIPPAIAIRQNARGYSSRSTVGTRTEVLDYLRILFAKAGCLTCPNCNIAVTSMTPDTATAQLLRMAEGRRAMVVVSNFAEQLPSAWLERGFTRAICDGMMQSMESLTAGHSADFQVVIDRIRIAADTAGRITESIEQAFAEGDGKCVVLVDADAADDEHSGIVVDGKSWNSIPLSRHPQCHECGQQYSTPTAESLSFHSPLGACSTCEGSGQISGMTFDKVVPDRTISLQDGAIQPWTTPAYRHELDELLDLAGDYNIPVDCPFDQLDVQHLHLIENGVPERQFGGLKGFHRWLVKKRYKPGVSVFLNRWQSWLSCPDCQGTRLNSSAGSVRLGNKTIAQTCELELSDLRLWLRETQTEFTPELQATLSTVLQQLTSRLQFLIDSGLDYLTLDRTMRTLSGGEAQRVVLTSALGTGLINTLYVLDEPTSGLHPSDTQKVIQATRRLQQLGNTVLVVEHDRDFILAADDIIEIGPAAGESGGEVVFQGTPQQLSQTETTATGLLLSVQGTETSPSTDRRSPENWLELKGVNCHNLKNVTAQIPLNVVCVVTGVSGSGKSSLIVDALYPHLRRSLGLTVDLADGSTVESIIGAESLTDVVLLDQKPLPRSRRSIPATIVGCFDDIRKVLADTHEAKKRNYKPGMFSFNSSSGGRCEVCEGHGVVTVEMQFLADIETTCEACAGRRFRSDVLEVRYRDRSIHDILEMTADQAFTFFNGHRRIQQRLNALRQAGLGYIRAGQPVSTLSGGESQRLRIAALLAGVPLDRPELPTSSRKPQGDGGSLFILDEPSTGLHMKDIVSLMACLNHLVEIGHSIIVIEHDPQIIQHCDYEIEMGPAAGRHGGQIVKAG